MLPSSKIRLTRFPFEEHLDSLDVRQFGQQRRERRVKGIDVGRHAFRSFGRHDEFCPSRQRAVVHANLRQGQPLCSVSLQQIDEATQLLWGG